MTTFNRNIRVLLVLITLIGASLTACDEKPVGETQINKAESQFFQTEETCPNIVC